MMMYPFFYLLDRRASLAMTKENAGANNESGVKTHDTRSLPSDTDAEKHFSIKNIDFM